MFSKWSTRKERKLLVTQRDTLDGREMHRAEVGYEQQLKIYVAVISAVAVKC